MSPEHSDASLCSVQMAQQKIVPNNCTSIPRSPLLNIQGNRFQRVVVQQEDMKRLGRNRKCHLFGLQLAPGARVTKGEDVSGGWEMQRG